MLNAKTLHGNTELVILIEYNVLGGLHLSSRVLYNPDNSAV